jgi:hypothetical protein
VIRGRNQQGGRRGRREGGCMLTGFGGRDDIAGSEVPRISSAASNFVSCKIGVGAERRLAGWR